MSGVNKEVSDWVAMELETTKAGSKRDVIREIVSRLLRRQKVAPHSVMEQVAVALGVSVGYFFRVVSKMKTVSLAFNGAKHYRMWFESPVRQWSMCVWGPGSDEERDHHIEVLEAKGYVATERRVPLPFEYVQVRESGQVCHLEPCDTDRWSLVYSHHVEGKTDQQEVESEDHHAEG